ncbi:MAG: glycoside hydrolase family 3 N-terminal domain-containing protein, partial [Aristaeellaceae bacterium]
MNVDHPFPDAEALLRSMTPEQKLGQLFLISLSGTEPDREFLDIEAQYHFGNVFLSGQNLRSPEQVRRLNEGLRAVITEASGGVPPMIAVDEEGGSASQFPFSITRIPCSFTLGAAHQPGTTEALGHALGNDLSELGFNMLLGPVLDLCRSHSDRVIGVRAYGDDPLLAAELGTAFARGVEAGGCGCTFKHFPGYGDMSVIDGIYCNTSTPEELLEGDAYPFAQAIARGARCVMAGQIVLPRLPAAQPQLPASMSRDVIQGLLRDRLHFDGVVIA